MDKQRTKHGQVHTFENWFQSCFDEHHYQTECTVLLAMQLAFKCSLSVAYSIPCLFKRRNDITKCRQCFEVRIARVSGWIFSFTDIQWGPRIRKQVLISPWLYGRPALSCNCWKTNAWGAPKTHEIPKFHPSNICFQKRFMCFGLCYRVVFVFMGKIIYYLLLIKRMYCYG